MKNEKLKILAKQTPPPPPPKEFDIYIQDKFYKTVIAQSTNEAMGVAASDVQNGLVPDYDSSKGSYIKIISK